MSWKLLLVKVLIILQEKYSQNGPHNFIKNLRVLHQGMAPPCFMEMPVKSNNVLTKSDEAHCSFCATAPALGDILQEIQLACT